MRGGLDPVELFTVSEDVPLDVVVRQAAECVAIRAEELLPADTEAMHHQVWLKSGIDHLRPFPGSSVHVLETNEVFVWDGARTWHKLPQA